MLDLLVPCSLFNWWKTDSESSSENCKTPAVRVQFRWTYILHEFGSWITSTISGIYMFHTVLCYCSLPASNFTHMKFHSWTSVGHHFFLKFIGVTKGRVVYWLDKVTRCEDAITQTDASNSSVSSIGLQGNAKFKSWCSLEKIYGVSRDFYHFGNFLKVGSTCRSMLLQGLCKATMLTSFGCYSGYGRHVIILCLSKSVPKQQLVRRLL